MGTNYYMKKSGACPCCKREHETLHIGKSSAGWCFALHVMPERGINDLEDWQKLWNEPGVTIETEYGEQVTAEEMTQVITQRSRDKSVDETFRTNPGAFGSWYSNARDFYNRNGATPGPNNLLRHRIDSFGHCVKHGAGTWDCIEGEFS